MATINWTLKKGAHNWPGPDGGSCVNEAAVIAAGLEYRAVKTVEDCPPCFSRCIAEYALWLNQGMPDDLRQELLLPFVPRLAGTADTDEAERARAEYMAAASTNRLLAAVCEVYERPDFAALCRNAATLEECDAVCDRMTGVASGSPLFVERMAFAAQQTAFNAAPRRMTVIEICQSAAWDIRLALASRRRAQGAARAAIRKKFFVLATEILDGAIRLGRHAEPDIARAVARLDRARGQRLAA